ncbi:hypothetical protein CH373_18340 [Leptospira perolatii]|uniref:Histidine kinase domain-containing protein n=1 Tax=Leptospira perolatii TaxID=2023191 RepID=A0A2M9ZI25_9LEPT|nr:GAF domain-containing sensor histidine kinase [Leptospira perolatii]PJZ69489.1 hypothetical protein CH360_10805 [Leptospira perolatii]PJZ71661.1 hypothetical protein CH373_18340 [Leptospira perolatii]
MSKFSVDTKLIFPNEELNGEAETTRILLRNISVLELLQQISSAANESTDLEALLQFAIDRICVITNWKLANVYLWSDQKKRLEISPIWFSQENASLKSFRKYIEETFYQTSLAPQVLREKKAIWLDPLNENLEERVRNLAEKAGVNSAFASPIWNRDKVIGVLEFYCNPADMTPTFLEALANIGSQIGRVFERSEAENYLRKSQEQLRALSARLQEVREEERVMISREIHDELGQILTVLKIDTSLLKYNILKGTSEHKESGKKLALETDLDSMLNLIESAIKSVQRIATQLRPMILDELGLIEAIEWYTEEFQKRTGINCSIHKSWNDSAPLSQEHSVALFRVFQETLTNIARHSKAEKAEIYLEQTDIHVTLTVIDNGIGISSEKLYDSKSLGLIGMQERAIVLGGDVQIQGGNGTKIRVRIPKNPRNGKGGVI